MRTNVKAKEEVKLTHGGGRAATHQSAFQELQRAVSTCMLFENTFYESGNFIATRIKDLCLQVEPDEIATLAVQARNDMKLRHVPLFLLVQLAHLRYRKLADTVYKVVQRADEMGELLALYWKQNGKDSKGNNKPVSNQLKDGLARAYTKFNEYQLSKWNRDSEVKLRDVMFIVHPKPAVKDVVGKRKKTSPKINKKQYKRGATVRNYKLWENVAENRLESADTWEVALSAGKDKKETWERLLKEEKLGDMAVLMNLRNMQKAGVDRQLIVKRLINWNPKSVVLPFRFITAAMYAPDLEQHLGTAIHNALLQFPKLKGHTLFVIDVSGSMNAPLSEKTQMDRVDAACGLAMFVREVCEDVTIYATGGNDSRSQHATAKIPPRNTFALRDAIKDSMRRLGGGGIFVHQALTFIKKKGVEFDRVIIITDEQDCDHDKSKTLSNAPKLAENLYLMNVAPYKPGLDTSHGWTRINGWSEQIIRWIAYNEGYGMNNQETED